MNLQDMFRVAMMDHFMASTGCSFRQADIILAACERRIPMPTDALITGMILRKVRREMFGVDTIANN